MKKKTSVSIDSKILAVVKREAKRQDRSVSYILEKFIEEKAQSIAGAQAETYPAPIIALRAAEESPKFKAKRAGK